MLLHWVDDHRLTTAAGTEYLTLGPEGSFAIALARAHREHSTPERFVLLKSRECLGRYEQLIETLEPERIVELGIYEGGSTALLLETAEPSALLAVEYEPGPLDALASFLRTHDRDSVATVACGTDQGDTPRLVELVDECFGADPIDLVIDDASHLGPQTRSSFETLFPRLRPGGVFVIEDWSWHLQGLDLPGESMDGFVTDLFEAAGRGPNLIARIEMYWDVLLVHRGPAPVDATGFELATWADRMV